jgi:tRNA nucleotidyltransferase (CCA-adding enzyme)
MDAPSCKRLIDGTQLARALGVKPGKWMASALEVCMAWQFRNPGVIDPSDAVEEVRARSEELQIPFKKVKSTHES